MVKKYQKLGRYNYSSITRARITRIRIILNARVLIIQIHWLNLYYRGVFFFLIYSLWGDNFFTSQSHLKCEFWMILNLLYIQPCLKQPSRQVNTTWRLKVMQKHLAEKDSGIPINFFRPITIYGRFIIKFVGHSGQARDL